MPAQTEKLERLRALHEARQERMLASIFNRWGVNDRSLVVPQLREPPEVRILIYADGDLHFRDLTHIRALLKSQPYPYINFKITTAHREEDALADEQRVTLANLNILENFDELWLFCFTESPPVPNAETDLVKEFMAAPKFGGVLITGDHGGRGNALGANIPRAGVMRVWTIDGTGPKRHSSLEDGPDEGSTFDDDDQSDDRPQTIRYTRFPIGAPAGVKLQPHPVLSGPDGPIEVLPDHQHEGEAVAPQPAPNDPIWPEDANGHQEQPVVIAFGEVKDPQVHYKQFGVISAYNGHTVDVGRIVADSSWHHWLDVNLLGRDNPPFNGFDATPAGEIVLKKIETYFLNCAVWLAPPNIQRRQRNAAWWPLVWTDELMRIPPDAPLEYFGERAIKELRRFASSGAVSEWVLGPVIFNKALSDWRVAQLSERSSLFNLSVEKYIAGGILRSLMNRVGPFNPEARFMTEAPPDIDLERAINDGAAAALSTLQEQLGTEVTRLQNAVTRLRLR